jgi:hypothetical protein
MLSFNDYMAIAIVASVSIIYDITILDGMEKNLSFE